MIRFKVVKKRTRMSAVIDGRSGFGIKYLRGTKVFANPKTLGIMTFKTYDYAYDWINSWYSYSKELMIIQVRPLCRGFIPDQICSSMETRLLYYFYARNKYPLYSGYLVAPPDGTICYKGVEVLT